MSDRDQETLWAVVAVVGALLVVGGGLAWFLGWLWGV